MWAQFIFRKLKKCANGGTPEANVGRVCFENKEVIILALQSVMRIKVVSWLGSPKKAEPEAKSLPHRVCLESDFREQQ